MIADSGFDPDFGARPVKRAVQNMIEDPLALQMLSGRFSDGDTVTLSFRNGQLLINGSPAESPRQ
jgi:ATP-dependent Clp protease ATP-binding subunit ClpA